MLNSSEYAFPLSTLHKMLQYTTKHRNKVEHWLEKVVLNTSISLLKVPKPWIAARENILQGQNYFYILYSKF